MANKKSTLPYIPIPYPLGNIKGPGQGSNVPMPQPQAGDVYNGYWDLFQQFGNYDQNFWETLFDLNETDARDFAFNQLGKQQDYLALLEQRGYDKSQLQDQRNYDFALLQNQRQYESPAAQLGRLMQTGLSRQAALQMINNGVVQPTAGTPTQSQGIPGSSDGAGVSAASAANGQNTLNAIGTAIKTVLSLASFGVSASAASATSSMQAAQTYALQQGNRAQKLSAMFNHAAWKKAQSENLDLSSMSFDDATKLFSDDSTINSILDEGLSTPGGYRIFSDNFNTRFDNKSKFEQARQAIAQSQLMELQPLQLMKAITLQDAEIEKTFTEITNIESETEARNALLPFQQNVLSSQAEQSSSQAEHSRAEVSKLEQETAMLKIAANRMQLTKEDLDATAISQAGTNLQIALAQGDPETIKYTLARIVDDEKQMRALAAFNVYRFTNLQSMLNSPGGETLGAWHNVFNTMGLGSMFEMYLENENKINNKSFNDFMGTFGIGEPKNIFGSSKPKSPENPIVLFNPK